METTNTVNGAAGRVMVLVQDLGLDHLLRAYEGRAGACMCGCKGTYLVTEASRVEAGRDRGYEYGDADVSDARVLGRLRRLQAEAAEGAMVRVARGMVMVRTGKRSNREIVLYLRPGVQVVLL